jgi:hypothetical protein
MAVLDPVKIPNMLKKRGTTNRDSEFDRCIRHDKRAVMHTEAFDKEGDIKHFHEFLTWVRGIISAEKFEVFKHLLTFPLATVDITEGIFNELKKIFDAHNRVISHQFTNPSLIDDCNEYRKKIRDYDFWQTDGFSAMKSAINSIMIVDLPALKYDEIAGEFEQTSDKPEPYFYLLDIEHVIEMDVKRGSWRVEYIIFNDPIESNKIHVFDDLFYRTYLRDNRGEHTLVGQSPHDLGYCPARSFWTTPFSRKSKIQKLAPISKSLSSLDWLLTSIVLKRHLGLYAGFPIYQSYEQRCDYVDEETGAQCDHGVLHWEVPATNDPNIMIPKTATCKKCGGNRGGLGAGTHIIVPGRSSNDDPDMINGISVVGAEKDSLDYNKQEVDDQIAWITYNIIGIADEMTREAVNEKQVTANFESRQTVLTDIKTNFELIHKWTTETWCRLRYGKQFVGCTIDYGSIFFLYTTGELMDMYKTAKENGLPNSELSNIRMTLITTKYRNNPDMLKRMKVLAEIEPYPGYSLNDLNTLKNLIKIDQRLIELKANFDIYIKRFEREYVDVVSFMQFNDLQTKIDLMNEIIMGYVEEAILEMEPEPVNGGSGNPNGDPAGDDGGSGSGQNGGKPFGGNNGGQPAPGKPGATS